jgi:hypothetical protein
LAKQGETDVWKRAQLDSSPLGYRLFRNQRYKGQTIKGAWVDTGVGGNGGSDLIGYKIVTITPDMVGKNVAIFAALEAKKGKNGASEDQIKFINAAKNNGGIAGVFRNLDDIIQHEKEWVDGYKNI